MRDQSLRGSSLNSRSLASDEGIEYSQRKRVVYDCPVCAKSFTLTFAHDAESPLDWSCPTCSAQAELSGAVRPQVSADNEEKALRTPFDMLLERRSREELEIILDERLAYLRSRRGKEKLGA
ncbi:unannotated protein [freshwater metagenome]|uniref:Unannotated protein n=1 Tax=freshwater metagenome TaxID=449393 RepID=A0A6J7FJT8_9ZZZZ